MTSYWIETLGCAKNEVDSDKLGFRAQSVGMHQAKELTTADLILVNTCAFIESAREESISVILDTLATKSTHSKVVVTGCMAERYRSELMQALPEVDLIVGFGEEFLIEQPKISRSEIGVPISISRKRKVQIAPKMDLDSSFDLLNLPIGRSHRPYAYLKVAEGCNRKCGFCAIPSFRGPQRSRDFEELLDEARVLGSPEIIAIAQDLASYGTDIYGKSRLVELLSALNLSVPWVRLLYIYPSQLNSALIEAIGESRLNYFDLSLQHVSRSLLRRMRRPGSAQSYLDKIERIRREYPSAVFRSNFIVGYPGETEDDHDQLIEFISSAKLDWVGFFPFSDEEGTYAHDLDDHVPQELIRERLSEVSEIADSITRVRRASQVGRTVEVLVQSPGVARSYMESPEIDGVIKVANGLTVGKFYDVVIDDCDGIDLVASLVKGGE